MAKYAYFDLEISFETPIQIQLEEVIKNAPMHKGFPARLIIARMQEEEICYVSGIGQVYDKILSK